MERVKVTIKTLSPVILTRQSDTTVLTETNSVFSGTVLRGILAKRYISQQNLGAKAHRDDAFRRLFFGKTCFVDALPVVNGSRSLVLPPSLQKSKKDGSLLDLLTEPATPGYKAFKGLADVSAGNIMPAEVQRTITFHMSRSSAEERITGRSLDGGIYNYEALAAGQLFEGTLIGEREDLELLLAGLETDTGFICYVGRSKYTQYGKCELKLGEIEALPVPDLPVGDTIYLRLDTPFLPWNDTTTDARASLSEVTERLNERTGTKSFTIGDIFASAEATDNFVGVWGMRRPRQLVLAAGSVFALKKSVAWTRADMEALQQLLYGGIGARTAEGLGQLRIWQTGELAEGAAVIKRIPKPEQFAPEVKRVACNMLTHRILEKVRIQAFEDAEASASAFVGKAHALARLESLLGTKAEMQNLKYRFAKNLENELRDQAPFKTFLENTYIGNKHLSEILQGRASQPYELLKWEDVLPAGLAEEIGYQLPDKDSDAIFYEYWLWFFRHARKQGTNRKGAKQND